MLQLVAEGFANKQIAAELSISIKTVEKHRQQAMNKLNIHDVAGLTRYAIAKGWVERERAGRAVSPNAIPGIADKKSWQSGRQGVEFIDLLGQ